MTHATPFQEFCQWWIYIHIRRRYYFYFSIECHISYFWHFSHGYQQLPRAWLLIPKSTSHSLKNGRSHVRKNRASRHNIKSAPREDASWPTMCSLQQRIKPGASQSKKLLKEGRYRWRADDLIIYYEEDIFKNCNIMSQSAAAAKNGWCVHLGKTRPDDASALLLR